jgi:hypothetical protein
MGSCKFIVDHCVQRKNEAIKMKIVGASESASKDGEKPKGCVYQCQLSNGTIVMCAEEELDHWDDTPTTEVFIDADKK